VSQFPGNRDDRDFEAFYDNGQGQSTRRVGATGSILAGITWDDIQASKVGSTLERYDVFLDGTQVARIEITYEDSTKEFITRARKVSF